MSHSSDRVCLVPCGRGRPSRSPRQRRRRAAPPAAVECLPCSILGPCSAQTDRIFGFSGCGARSCKFNVGGRLKIKLKIRTYDAPYSRARDYDRILHYRRSVTRLRTEPYRTLLEDTLPSCGLCGATDGTFSASRWTASRSAPLRAGRHAGRHAGQHAGRLRVRALVSCRCRVAAAVQSWIYPFSGSAIASNWR